MLSSKPTKHILILILAVLIFHPVSSFGEIVDPMEIGVGARALGMGKAFSGIYNDINCIFTNPAGIADINKDSYTGMNGKIYTDISYNLIAASRHFEYGTLAFSFINLGTPGIPVTTISSGGTVELAGATDYSSSVFMVSYGNKLSSLPYLGELSDMTYGVNLKYYIQGVYGGGVDLRGNGIDMDLAMQQKRPFGMPITCGITLMNIIPDSLGGNFTWNGSEKQSIPLGIRYGIAAKVLGMEDAFNYYNNDVYVLFDQDTTPERINQVYSHLGLEWWLSEQLAARAGINQTANGAEIDNNLTGGIGLKYSDFTFDFSYNQFGELAENTTYFFSLGYSGK